MARKGNRLSEKYLHTIVQSLMESNARSENYLKKLYLYNNLDELKSIKDFCQNMLNDPDRVVKLHLKEDEENPYLTISKENLNDIVTYSTDEILSEIITQCDSHIIKWREKEEKKLKIIEELLNYSPEEAREILNEKHGKDLSFLMEIKQACEQKSKDTDLSENNLNKIHNIAENCVKIAVERQDYLHKQQQNQLNFSELDQDDQKKLIQNLIASPEDLENTLEERNCKDRDSLIKIVEYCTEILTNNPSNQQTNTLLNDIINQCNELIEKDKNIEYEKKIDPVKRFKNALFGQNNKNKQEYIKLDCNIGYDHDTNSYQIRFEGPQAAQQSAVFKRIFLDSKVDEGFLDQQAEIKHQKIASDNAIVINIAEEDLPRLVKRMEVFTEVERSKTEIYLNKETGEWEGKPEYPQRWKALQQELKKINQELSPSPPLLIRLFQNLVSQINELYQSVKNLPELYRKNKKSEYSEEVVKQGLNKVGTPQGDSKTRADDEIRTDENQTPR